MVMRSIGSVLATITITNLTAAEVASDDRSAFVGAPPAWLPALTANNPAVLLELQALADQNELEPVLRGQAGRHAFQPDWQNLALDGPDSWRSLALLNKGRFDDEACRLTPRTCHALASVLPQLAPTERAPNVGCRVVRLAPGATLRPHRGPGGRPPVL